MTRWLDYFQHLAIYINENLPNGMQNLPKSVQNFPNYEINPQKFAQDFEDFAKMAKFREIWSQWSQANEKERERMCDLK